jgi:hypothetical protein
VFTLATIVEGHGDVAAVPVLLRRLRPDWVYTKPIRQNRAQLIDSESKLARSDVMLRNIRLATSAVAEHSDRGGILLIYDADDDCAVSLGKSLRKEASRHTSLPCEAVLAVREYEAWLLAGQCIDWRDDPERPRDAKSKLSASLGVYRETVDQPKLTAALNIASASEGSRSFRQLLTALDRLDPAASQH